MLLGPRLKASAIHVSSQLPLRAAAYVTMWLQALHPRRSGAPALSEVLRLRAAEAATPNAAVGRSSCGAALRLLPHRPRKAHIQVRLKKKKVPKISGLPAPLTEMGDNSGDEPRNLGWGDVTKTT